jgi:hypothetical protein
VIKGSCCCGAVKFELLNQPSMMGTCHCSRCRKVGASTIVYVKREDLKWVQGKEYVEVYKPQSPYKYERSFCKMCGTSLGEILSDLDSFPIAANALDDEMDVKNSLHEFVDEKPSWYKICDDARQSKGHPTT